MLEKHEYCAIILKKEEFANGNTGSAQTVNLTKSA